MDANTQPCDKPIQKILFGSPGTGKSYRIRSIARKELGMTWDRQCRTLKNAIKTAFSPEYTSADFIGRFLVAGDRTPDGCKFSPGHFWRALSLAYQSLLTDSAESVLLVIDRLNRGNATAIFGPILHLLDRHKDGWSTYTLDISEPEIASLFQGMGYSVQLTVEKVVINGVALPEFCRIHQEKLEQQGNEAGTRLLENLQHSRIAIPNNLSLLATADIGDGGIYRLDPAFKRCWDWEYLSAPCKSHSDIPEKLKDVKILAFFEAIHWSQFVICLNEFIRFNAQTIPRIDSKQIGWWFIKPKNDEISEDTIQNKLMFYLWDDVFAENPLPLSRLLSQYTNQEIHLTTYRDFVSFYNEFILAIVSELWRLESSS